MKGYKIDFTTNTLVMNYKFSAAAQVFGSAENKLMRNIQKAFPQLSVAVRPGRVVKTTAKNKRLTYTNMETYISQFKNADELLRNFNVVKALSKPLASPYAFVSDWFVAQFPNYKEVPTFTDGSLTLTPIPLPTTDGYKQKDLAS